jgi:hypothetical protein
VYPYILRVSIAFLISFLLRKAPYATLLFRKQRASIVSQAAKLPPGFSPEVDVEPYVSITHLSEEKVRILTRKLHIDQGPV